MFEIDIKNYIEFKIPELKDKLYPLFGTNIGDLFIAYVFTPLSGGHIAQSQIELKIIDSSYDECKRVEKLITNILDFEEDAPYARFNDTYFRGSLAGGGCLFNVDIQKYENTLYFIIKYRRIN